MGMGTEWRGRRGKLQCKNKQTKNEKKHCCLPCKPSGLKDVLFKPRKVFKMIADRSKLFQK